MSGHAYWRVVIESNYSGTNYSCAELELRDVNGTNCAVDGTALTNSYLSTYTADQAFDGSTSTFWASNGKTGLKWLGYHLPSPAEIVGIAWRARPSSFYNESPTKVHVQYSDDGVAWFDAWAIADASAWASSQQKVWARPDLDPEASHARWRIMCIEPAAGEYFAVKELEFRASPGGANLCSGGTPSASVEFGGTFTAAEAFDGVKGEANQNDYWAANTSAAPGHHWLRYDFLTAVAVRQVELTAIYVPEQTPTTFAVECSDDGAGWVALWNVTTDAWSANETRSFTYEPAVPSGSNLTRGFPQVCCG